jgi:hypothetical protein
MTSPLALGPSISPLAFWPHPTGTVVGSSGTRRFHCRPPVQTLRTSLPSLFSPPRALPSVPSGGGPCLQPRTDVPRVCRCQPRLPHAGPLYTVWFFATAIIPTRCGPPREVLCCSGTSALIVHLAFRSPPGAFTPGPQVYFSVVSYPPSPTIVRPTNTADPSARPRPSRSVFFSPRRVLCALRCAARPLRSIVGPRPRAPGGLFLYHRVPPPCPPPSGLSAVYPASLSYLPLHLTTTHPPFWRDGSFRFLTLPPMAPHRLVSSHPPTAIPSPPPPRDPP